MDENTLKKQIGYRIKQWRVIKRWSRQQVADKLELSVTSYGSIERGETDMCIMRLAQLAEIFEVTLPDLLGLSEKTIFNFTGTHNKECHNWQVSSPPEMKEWMLKNELEKYQWMQQAQEKEIEYLKQQIAQLQEINQLLKQKSSES